MTELTPEGFSIQKGSGYDQLLSNSTISIVQRLGPQYDVAISILRNEGEKYMYNRVDPKIRKLKSHTDIVPKGYSYIRISSKRPNIRDFWQAVEAEKRSQQNSSNPSKI